LSGWWLLWNKFNPFGKREKIPNLSDIQAQLAYVSSEKVLQEVKNQKRCFYLRPPIAPYGTLDFMKFDEISQVGYNYALEQIKIWKEQRSIYSLQEENPLSEETVRKRRRYSADGNLQKYLTEFQETLTL
jgi:lysophospholipid hydrolase